MHLPAALIRTLHDVHDDAGPWLAALPETLARLGAAWNIRVTGLVPQLSYNLVLYAERTDEHGVGTPCILKLSPPSDDLIREGEALLSYAGDGICQLLERDDAVSALLLERVLPGVSLQEVWTLAEDDLHTRVTAELMRRLWRPVAEPNPFRSLQSWARALYDDPGPSVPTVLREKAQRLLLELGPDKDPMLLHADLHHGNILTATTLKVTIPSYRAIDPKGIVGARGYDVGTYLLDPVQATAEELLTLLPRRLEVFSEVLGLEGRELAAWGFVHAILSVCWSAEDHGDRDGWFERELTVARALARLY